MLGTPWESTSSHSFSYKSSHTMHQQLQFIRFAEKPPLKVASKSEVMSAGVFDPISFAEGRFRRAYMGTYTAPLLKAGQKMVVKELKESYTWNPNDWNSTVKIQQESQRLADGFNQYYSTRFPNSISFPIRFTDVCTAKVTAQQSATATPKLNEYVIVEDFIPGQFKKWVNNYGYVSDEFMSMPAFAHWSWCYTNGEKMIADLQGVRGDMNYTLTDPVLMSGSADGGIYGCTDMGVEGIILFFYNHKCNSLCDNLPRPTPASLGISQWQWQMLTLKLQQIMNATAYSHEKQLPYDVRVRLVQSLKVIASSYV